ncbi:hypothetical protein BKA69DRAFT_1050972, partial [Paraphysoderma sedebokerense]
MYQILRSACLYCHKFRLTANQKLIFSSKLVLLQKGLILESMEIDSIVESGFKNTSPKSKSKSSAKSQSELNDTLEEHPDSDAAPVDYDATEDAFTEEGNTSSLRAMTRLKSYVKNCLELLETDAQKLASSKLSAQEKVTLTTQYRREIINGIIKRLISCKKCSHCGAHAVNLRRDGFSKIFIVPFSKSVQSIMAAKGFKLDEHDVVTKAKNLDENAFRGDNATRDEFGAADAMEDFSFDPNEEDIGIEEKDESEDSDAELEERIKRDGAKAFLSTEANVKRSKKTTISSANDSSNRSPSVEEGKAINTYLSPLTVRAHLKLLWYNESSLLDLIYNPFGASVEIFDSLNKQCVRATSCDMFFLEVVAVPPGKFRPPSVMGDMKFDHPQNHYLNEVLNIVSRINEYNTSLKQLSSMDPKDPNKNQKRQQLSATINYNWLALQSNVNGLMDSTKAGTYVGGGKQPPSGIRQILEKKEGLFRKHMMGKRVNYAARSVISPDPWIETSEIGIPPVFASKLTYPEPVTPHNYTKLRQAVINGPNEWPGASHVQLENGYLQDLGVMSKENRIALANQLMTPQQQFFSDQPSYHQNTNKKVLRHLQNGDILLLNRQPTLHKPSIMAHRARILPGEKTIRLHYANCNTYNADFDGDEMNVHFPQNEIARAEAYTIANTDNQYLVPTDGSPLRGLIQDHVVTGVMLTSRDTFLSKDDYQQILMGSLPERIMEKGRLLLMQPAVIKPRKMWTGKQVISTILLNLTQDDEPLNLTSKPKVGGKYWGSRLCPVSEEGEVIFLDGELLTGVLDKSQFGASGYGLVHSVYELYGPSVAGDLLSTLGRLFSKYLQFIGFTCRMDDLRLTKEGDSWRRGLLHEGRNYGTDVALEYTSLKEVEQMMPEEELQSELKRRMEEVLRHDEKLAGLDASMKSKINGLTSSIIGKCIPDGLLKLFPQNGMQLMTVSGAKGSNVNVSQISCLLGQQELEGRRVPIMVSGKSLPSFLPFDTSARAGGFIGGRFLTGIRPQEYYFHHMAGREGLIDTAVKTSRSGYLQRCLMKHLEGLKVAYDHTVRDADGSILQFQYGEDALDVIKQKHLTQFRFCAENANQLSRRLNVEGTTNVIDERSAHKYAKKASKKKHKYDPVLSKFVPSRFLGATSERFEDDLEKYTTSNPDGLILSKAEKDKDVYHGIQDRKFKVLMRLKYLKSLVEPGEAVGVLAAQSIGEPSTQMTLNTFHFAGFGAKNVTLGIPRLREIVMTASACIKTPNMTLPLLPHVSEEAAETFSKEMTKLTLAAISQEVVVTEKLTRNQTGRVRHYRIRINFFDQEDYKEVYDVDASEIDRVIETRFVSRLEHEIAKTMKLIAKRAEYSEVIEVHRETIPRQTSHESQAQQKSKDDESDDETQEGDASFERQSTRRKQHASYDAPDEDDQEIIRELQSKDENDESDALDVSANNSVEESDRERLDRMTSSNKFLVGYKFDKKHGSWCEVELELPGEWKKLLMVNIVETVCHQTIIHEVQGISRCFPLVNETENDTSVSL